MKIRLAVSDPPDEDESPFTKLLGRRRNQLTVALGAIWLLDAALQYQPYMFTLAFPTQTIAPSGQGSPIWVSGPVDWAANLMSSNIIVWNALFATTQLLIALGIFWPRSRRIALIGSIAWALGVWWMGEGMGGTFAGPMSPLMGLPGGALLYAVIAVLVWPHPAKVGEGVQGQTVDSESVATSSLLRMEGSKLIWLALWVGFAVESLVPANAGPQGIYNMIQSMIDGEPGWIQSMNRATSDLVQNRGTPISIVLAVLCFCVALGVFFRRTLVASLIVSMVVSLLIWVFAEDFGGIFSGSGTDPNTGPLLVLLAACFWPLLRADRRGSKEPVNEGGDS